MFPITNPESEWLPTVFPKVGPSDNYEESKLITKYTCAWKMKIKKFLYSSTHALMFHPDYEDEKERQSITYSDKKHRTGTPCPKQRIFHSRKIIFYILYSSRAKDNPETRRCENREESQMMWSMFSLKKKTWVAVS